MPDTPLMVQYKEMKKQYQDMILFFRLGDFYEMFDEDAVEVSALLNLTLTHKGESPMCGIPFHAARNYIKRLLDCSKKIAICEQLSLADSPKALAKREVVRIITPATVVEEDFLDERSFNYILCVFQYSCSFCDVSTGEIHLRQIDRVDRVQDIRSLIMQISPKEILVCEDEYFMDHDFKDAIDFSNAMVTKLAPWYFALKESRKLLCEQAGVQSLVSFGLKDSDKCIGTCGALLRYVRETSKASVSHLTNYIVDTKDDYLSMDESSRRNLELFTSISERTSKYSLCETVNKCRTSAGTRLLKEYISFPLRNIEQIRYRQKWVGYFVENKDERTRVRDLISSSSDLNRLTTRILLKRSVPHDLTSVKQSIGTFLNLVSHNPEKYSELFEASLNEEQNLAKAASLMEEIDRAVNPLFLGQFNPGEVILDGYDEDLTEKRRVQSQGDSVLSSYLEEEKQRSGLSILKCGYNRVYGYYLEVPNGQLSRVPDYFLRKQTLVNGERFTTQRLQEYEKQILNAASLCEERERMLYENLNSQVLEISPVLNSIGRFMSLVDVFQGLATLAVENNYVCPEITEENKVEITDGRHPVVEKQLGPGKFTANSLDTSIRFSLITGPNMAGKSTYLRQNALIVLLAHIGSFVPAKKAVIGLTDKIFCRVGAMDNLARGESTFLVEMQETAYILRNCTPRSFVIVDEIGRGTSTQDGMALAYAIMKNLIQSGANTLFATHYHELTMLDTHGIRLLTLEVEEKGEDIRFIRKVKEGVANSSYGIHVAKLAGVPYQVIREAKAFQSRHFEDYGNNQQNSLFTSDASQEPEVSFSSNINNEIVSEIKEADIDSLTPLQAMLFLSKLKEKADREC